MYFVFLYEYMIAIYFKFFIIEISIILNDILNEITNVIITTTINMTFLNKKEINVISTLTIIE
jgi:hypothetical protein